MPRVGRRDDKARKNATRQALRRLTSVLVYMWEGMDGRVRGDAAAAMKRGDCVADSAPIAPKLLKRPPPCRVRIHTLRERGRVTAHACRARPSAWPPVGIAHYHSIGRHEAAARGCRLYPSGTGDVGPIGV